MKRVHSIHNSIAIFSIFLLCQLAAAQQADPCTLRTRQADIRRAAVQAAIINRIRQSGRRMRDHLQRSQRTLSPALRRRITLYENRRRQMMQTIPPIGHRAPTHPLQYRLNALRQQEGTIIRQIQRQTFSPLPPGMFSMRGRASNGSDVICDEISFTDLGATFPKIKACYDFVIQNFVTRPLSEPSFSFMPHLVGRFYSDTPVESNAREPYMTSVHNLALSLVPVPTCALPNVQPPERILEQREQRPEAVTPESAQ